MLKTIGYHLFAFTYDLCRLFPVKNKNVLCIMTHDDGEGSNVSIVSKALQRKDKGYTFAYITKTDSMDVKGFADWRKVISFFIKKPYQAARAQIILMDNIFLPFAYLRIRKGVKVVQLWHGTGTIKKFGQDVNTGKLKELEYRANRNITHLIVNSPEIKKLYAKVFGIDEARVYPIGLPKTDDLVKRIRGDNGRGVNDEKGKIYQKYNIPKDCKLVLYAPTFRDRQTDNPELIKNLYKLEKVLPEGYYLGLRLHPFIAAQFDDIKNSSRIRQLSFEKDLTGVLLAADILITDYSSIIFEFCITGRPMVFYAYDLAEFSDQGRGFYYDYESYVPGPVAYTDEEIGEILKDNRFDLERIREFYRKNFPHADGNATERLLKLL